jgi:hypothetical protein
MGNLPLLVGTWTGGDGLMVVTFLITPPKMDVRTLSIGNPVPRGERTNSMDISKATIDFVGHKFGTRFASRKKQHLFGQFGIRQLPLTSGGLMLHRHPFPSNVFSASLTQVNQFSINFENVSAKGIEMGYIHYA